MIFGYLLNCVRFTSYEDILFDLTVNIFPYWNQNLLLNMALLTFFCVLKSNLFEKSRRLEYIIFHVTSGVARVRSEKAGGRIQTRRK